MTIMLVKQDYSCCFTWMIVEAIDLCTYVLDMKVFMGIRRHKLMDVLINVPLMHELWPLVEEDPQKAKFPCCVVWTPLPVVSWLAPFIGHVGVCREDGTIIDFSGSNLIQVDDFAFGPVGRYLQLDRKQGCFPPTLAGHTCKHHSMHAEYGTAISWDDAIQSSSRHYEHKSYNLFTCNCHSFVANCLNRMCYGGSMNWNVVNVTALILCKGSGLMVFLC
ncbi:UNVERIFIED_CONTAM: protein REVERSION-TO-ETHYLENE SENSITIVITY1 [Sesamum radiatum]|uniref:Protein REVERSION-TO-ETHYLENE SENSITIVITY1 n=1 Tax=Sesamum radiatum TaxID=300843 RepID=A0AAW2KY35_SESRA